MEDLQGSAGGTSLGLEGADDCLRQAGSGHCADESWCLTQGQPAGPVPRQQDTVDRRRYKRSQDRKRETATRLQELKAAIGSRIADHTNLLSRHATLEAARIGQRDPGDRAGPHSNLITFFAVDGERVQRPTAELLELLPEEVLQIGTVYASKLRPLLLAAKWQPAITGRPEGRSACKRI
ncbi:hypothetical protein WJX84_008329 [Apatococcus fuscideae]|uniref:Uncharacterized protein n=1 Tax=Apatococcus fuscideae TaxID=2026836 RepID=A0AAW1TIM2_9CHLO